MPQSPPANFLIPQYQSALGTVVHATPVVEELRRRLPEARIVVASSGMAAQVWQGNPHLERLVETPNPLASPLATARALRAQNLFGGERYTVLLTTGNERTKITLAMLLAGRSRRIGYAVHGRLVHTHLQFDPALSQIANNMRLLAALGVAVEVTAPFEPRLYPPDQHAVAHGLLGDLTRPRIALATQTSPTQRKSWPAESWLQLATALRSRYGAELIFVGATAEVPAIEEIRSSIPFATVSVAGQTTISQLAAVLHACDLGIMLDTGPLHVARGVSLPAVIIAPAWSPTHEWLPVQNPRYSILKNADFPAPAPDDYVITEVSVDEVLAAVDDLLIRTRPVAAAAERIPES